MIDFRYHLVSIVAIFLSLGLGLVLGATFLNDPVLNQLKDRTNTLAREKDELRERQRALEGQTKGDDQFARTLGANIVADRLKGESVVLVATPGANDQSLDQMTKLAGRAGATVTGRVTIQKKYLDDNQTGALDQLATSMKPAGLAFRANAGPFDRVGAVLASAVVTKEAGKAGREDATGGQILAAFKDQGFVTSSGKPGQHATLAVVIAPSTPYQGKSADTDNKALVSLADAFDDADRGTVLGGPSTAAQEGGLIAALRNSGTAERVSSVDTVDTASGQVVTVLALESELRGRSGQYGTGPDASGYLPSQPPAPGGSG